MAFLTLVVPRDLLQEGAGKVLGKLEKVVEAVQATSFKDPIFKSIHSLMYSKPVKAQEVGTSHKCPLSLSRL